MKKSALFFTLILMLIASGCASSAKTSMPILQNKSVDSNAPQSSLGERVLAPAAAPAVVPVEGGAVSDTSTSTSTGSSQTNASDRLVIKNANLSIVVKDPGKSMDTISKLADSMGGWVVSSSLYKASNGQGMDYPQASINIRVPADKLNDAMTQIKAEVENAKTDIRSENVTGEDVTSQYTDLKSRLTNLEDTEATLREIMASATKTEDVLAVYNQLSQIREQIEVLKGQIKYYEESAHYSAINVELISQESIKPITVGGWQPQGVVRDAFQALIDAGKAIFSIVIYLIILILPILVVFYLFIRLIIWIFRKLFPPKKKVVVAKDNPETPEQTTDIMKK
jgi:hypothetical protein